MVKNNESRISHGSERTDINHMDASRILQSLELKEEEEQTSGINKDEDLDMIFDAKQDLNYL